MRYLKIVIVCSCLAACYPSISKNKNGTNISETLEDVSLEDTLDSVSSDTFGQDTEDNTDSDTVDNTDSDTVMVDSSADTEVVEDTQTIGDTTSSGATDSDVSSEMDSATTIEDVFVPECDEQNPCAVEAEVCHVVECVAGSCQQVPVERHSYCVTPDFDGFCSIDGQCERWQISAGDFHSCLLTESGKVKCWGEHREGALGIGVVPGFGNEYFQWARLKPTEIGWLPLPKPVKFIDSGGLSTCVIYKDETAACWGFNPSGNLGGLYGSFGDDEVLEELPAINLTSIIKIETATSYPSFAELPYGQTCALSNDGVLRCWGDRFQANAEGSAGTKFANPSGEESFRLDHVVDFSVSERFACALVDDATIYCWGHNDSKQLGQSYSGDPVGVGASQDIGDAVRLGFFSQKLALGGEQACAISNIGKLKCWGDSSNGIAQSGDLLTSSPLFEQQQVVRVAVGSGVACFIDTEGVLRCWGNNRFGQLGLPTLTDTCPTCSGPENCTDCDECLGCYNSPSTIGSDGIVPFNSAVYDISIGQDHTCAILKNAEVRCWGANFRKQLGIDIDLKLGDDEAVTSVPAIVLE